MMMTPVVVARSAFLRRRTWSHGACGRLRDRARVRDDDDDDDGADDGDDDFDARAEGRRGTEVSSRARDPSAADATTIAPTRGGGGRG